MNTEEFAVKGDVMVSIICNLAIEIKVQNEIIIDLLCNRLSNSEEDYEGMAATVLKQFEEKSTRIYEQFFKDHGKIDLKDILPGK